LAKESKENHEKSKSLYSNIFEHPRVLVNYIVIYFGLINGAIEMFSDYMVVAIQGNVLLICSGY
jgi:hypothetical protein